MNCASACGITPCKSCKKHLRTLLHNLCVHCINNLLGLDGSEHRDYNLEVEGSIPTLVKQFVFNNYFKFNRSVSLVAYYLVYMYEQFPTSKFSENKTKENSMVGIYPTSTPCSI